MGPDYGEIRQRRGLRFSPRLVFGLGIMAVGLLLTLDNLGVVDTRGYWRFWPVILIAAGLAKGVESYEHRGRPAGVGLVLIGTLFLLDSVQIITLQQLWPLFLLGLGAVMVWKALTWPEGRPGGLRQDLGEKIRSSIESTRSSMQDGARTPIEADDTDPSARLSAVAVMAGVRKGTNNQDFRRGDAFAFMGGCEIDLREASIKDGGEAVFDTFAFMGGIVIRVPADWAVDNRGMAFMGGLEDKTRRPLDPRKRFVLTGLAVMGGVEVKN